MLYYVSGQVAILEPGLAVIDCNGVGYGCRVTAYTAARSPPLPVWIFPPGWKLFIMI